MNNKAVIGLGFGDEGKGLTTEYLVSKAKSSKVVRFSGGQQAGHTVYKNNIRHIFSNFGSGTLSGTETYWSEYCSVDPIGITNELNKLKSHGISPILNINRKSPITTPYDVFDNQSCNITKHHGTCGLGVGSTFNREEKFYSLLFEDLFNPKIFQFKLNSIKKYYFILNKSSKTPNIERFLDCVQNIINSSHIKMYDELNIKNNYVFEGSQGLLLDQHYGFFPNVTRSNTGSKNIKKIDNREIDYYLVTRAYQTRHGNGFMSNGELDYCIEDNPEETNKTNKYQGIFYKSMLDINLLEYGINKDNNIRKSNNKYLVITCLDHIKDNYKFTFKDKIVNCDSKKDFINKISNILDIKNVLISESPYSNNIKKFEI